MSITWEDPPQKIARGRRPSNKWIEILTPLMEYPGRWAIVASDERIKISYTAHGLRHGKRLIPEGIWEFTVRTPEDSKESNLYACYLGTNDGND